jgi:oligopeptide/dipeptide ABC transporter ATP-binding protein
MGVVAQTCQRVAVMYAGQIVELVAPRSSSATPPPLHRRAAELRAPPRRPGAPAEPIPGAPPDLATPPSGCRFHPRCPLGDRRLPQRTPGLREVAPGHFSRCIRHDEMTPDLWERLDA